MIVHNLPPPRAKGLAGRQHDNLPSSFLIGAPFASILGFATLIPLLQPNRQRWHAKNGSSSRNMHMLRTCSRTFWHPICVLGRCLATKFLRRKSVGSLLRVRCWLGPPPPPRLLLVFLSFPSFLSLSFPPPREREREREQRKRISHKKTFGKEDKKKLR